MPVRLVEASTRLGWPIRRQMEMLIRSMHKSPRHRARRSYRVELEYAHASEQLTFCSCRSAPRFHELIDTFDGSEESLARPVQLDQFLHQRFNYFRSQPADDERVRP